MANAFPSIETLNKKFGSPGRIAFREGPEGVPIAVLVAPAATCEVSLYGGQVLSYRPLGHQPVLYLSKLAAYTPGSAIRGGIPICWPWFGPAPADMPAGTQSHGFARRSAWCVRTTEYAKDTTAITLALTEQLATSPAWPHPYELQLTVTVGTDLALELQTRNTGPAPFTYSECLHAYLAVGDVAQCTLLGTQDVGYIDDMTSTQWLTHTDTLGFSAEQGIDRIYSRKHPEGIYAVLRDPVMDRTVSIVGEDVSGCVVWHVPEGHTVADLPADANRRFICVEPANPHYPAFQPITLAPNQTHISTLHLQPAPLKN